MQLKQSVLFFKIAALTSASVIILTSWFLYYEVSQTAQLTAQLEHVQTSLQRTMDQEEYLLIRAKKEYASTIPQLKYSYQDSFSNLLNLLAHQEQLLPLLLQLDDLSKSYFAKLEELVRLYEQLGYDENSGVYGEFRRSAHALQNRVSGEANLPLEVVVLELRRREKDFLLRADISYLKLHEQLSKQAQQLIAESAMDEEVSNLLERYQAGFANYVAILKKLGLNDGEGVRAELFTEKQKLRSQFELVSVRTQAQAQTRKENIILYGLTLIVLMNIAVLMLLSYQNSKVTRHILAINKVLVKVAKLEDFSLRVGIQGNDEIAQIGHQLDDLLAFIETLLARLSAAQQRLIEEAKMASLGNMVSGFAHELNTPLGVAITSQSHLKEQVATLKSQLELGKLQRQTLTTLITEAEAALYLLENNLHRTASLVDDFKLVAVNREFEEQSAFNLKNLVKNVFDCYQSELTQDAYSIELEIPDNLELISYPSVFSQVVGYCINNCIKHAKVDGKKLNIVVSTVLINDYIHFYFKDDGAGIDKELLPVIFEPFVTSKRFSGGTGLGLSIVYNLVTQKLKGEVKMQSPAHGGACLHIILTGTEFMFAPE
ncbi:sensor histidine kinase [Pseudoalteromonas piscicida]|uniref:histidine kinase n=1 Tax=Pseudoalteromonas piscicida TaxID=43662 RepID=A0A2A5JWJ5_PSEO7|nr:HAMP domain-containing sensor histidine kinase [Pseudoalteromonas piscicida]PCK33756.1 two-component sensor histidine kinase [Pseudoalteromonas piscicida]